MKPWIGWVVCCGALRALAGDVSLESARLRVSWDGERGAIVSFVDKQSGREFVPRGTSWPLYSIQLVDAAPVSSSDATRTTVEQDAGGVSVRCEHPQLTVVSRFRMEESSGMLLGAMELSASADIRLSSVRFGLMSVALPMQGDGSGDRVVLPNCDGQLHRDPAKNRFDKSLAYPGVGSMQMLAAYDGGGGVLLFSRDPDGRTKQPGARSDTKTLSLSITHLTEQAPLRQWKLPYEIAMTTFSGGKDGVTSWEAAADLYAGWARRQPWCARTLAQRVATGDVPAWLVQPSLFYAFSMQGQLKDGKTGDRLPLIVDHARGWREATGGPVTFMLMSWEKHGAWVTPDYFPPRGGDEGFSGVTRSLRKQGDRSLVFLSGLNWTLQKDRDGRSYDSQAEFDVRGRPSAISDAAGEALLTGTPPADVGRFARICSTTALAKEILNGSALRCQQLGIDCVQADQIVGGGQPLCYHPKHDHPPGGGAWCSKALYELFSEIRRDGKAKDAGFAFSIEEPAEFFIPVLDTYHARDYMQGRWPRTGAATEGIPLFTHVYHDYLHGYGGDSCYVSSTPSSVALYQQGMNLVCGKAPAVAVWTRWLDPAEVHPAQKRLLRGHMDLWRGPAREYLVFGRRVGSAPVTSETMDVTFSDGKANTKLVLAVPKVLDAVWQRADGRRARVYVCIAPEPQTLLVAGQSIRLEPGEAGLIELK